MNVFLLVIGLLMSLVGGATIIFDAMGLYQGKQPEEDGWWAGWCIFAMGLGLMILSGY